MSLACSFSHRLPLSPPSRARFLPPLYTSVRFLSSCVLFFLSSSFPPLCVLSFSLLSSRALFLPLLLSCTLFSWFPPLFMYALSLSSSPPPACYSTSHPSKEPWTRGRHGFINSKRERTCQVRPCCFRFEVFILNSAPSLPPSLSLPPLPCFIPPPPLLSLSLSLPLSLPPSLPCPSSFPPPPPPPPPLSLSLSLSPFLPPPDLDDTERNAARLAANRSSSQSSQGSKKKKKGKVCTVVYMYMYM